MDKIGQQQSAAGFPSRSDVEFRRLLETLPAAAYTCDADGLITYFNRRALVAWGRAPSLNDPTDRYCGSFKLFTPEGEPIPHERCWMALALRDGKEYIGREIVVEQPDGSLRTVLAHATPFRDQSGKVTGAVNVLVDITERRKAEDALRAADRNKNEFLAMLAHELRNPLAPLRNGLQIMRLAGNDGAVAAQAREMMERQLGHMVRLIDDLLDLSRISKGKIELRRERIELATVVHDAVESSRPVIEAAGHGLTVTLPSKPLAANADRIRLAQVVSNLLNNSAKYTPSGGRIRLTVERQGTDVVIEVADSGVGIPQDMLERVFDTFTQADRSLERCQGGLGIGLSLVRALVEMHGGTVEARSAGPGRGSEFVVRLSAIAPATAEPELPDTGHALTATSRQRILVADDNRDAAISLGMMLQIMGHDIRTVHNGIDAVEAAAAFRPGVALLDIGMPGLNGYDACRRIRRQPGGEAMVLIAITGWGSDDDKQRSKEAGFNFHMVKPVDTAALAKLLGGLLLVPA